MTNEKTVPKSYSADKFVVRLPDGMRNRIADVASRYHRSMNSEIVSRLETSLELEALKLGEATTSDQEQLSMQVTAGEKELIQFFRSLNTKQQQALVTLIMPSEG